MKNRRLLRFALRCGSCRRRGRLRARHLCRRRIGLVVLCAHGRCVRGRPSAADERARCAGAVAGCAEDIHAGRLRCVGDESFGVGAGLRARLFSAARAAHHDWRPRRDLHPHADCGCAARLADVRRRPRDGGPARRRDGRCARGREPGHALSGRPADERRDDGRAVDGDVRCAASPALGARGSLLRTWRCWFGRTCCRSRSLQALAIRD